jgi:hypothetical protein
MLARLMQADLMKVTAPKAWARGLELHNKTLRQLLVEHNGYECSEEGGSFCLAFHSATDAVQFGVSLQESMLTVRWPAAILDMPQACRMLIRFARPHLHHTHADLFLLYGFRVSGF